MYRELGPDVYYLFIYIKFIMAAYSKGLQVSYMT